MAFGDTRFRIYTTGSKATESSGINNLFGAYSGLSLLNNDEVILIQLAASVNEFFLGPSGNNAGITAGLVSNNVGLKVYPNTSGLDLPPMRAGTASLLQMQRLSGDSASFNNASVNWVVWTRSPGY